MAVNIVSLVQQFVTPQLIGRMASSLGVNPAIAQTLAAAALPAILAALGGVAATPAGAQNISNTISNQDPDLLGNLMKSIGGAAQGDAAAGGAGVLGSLIGNPALGGLAGALAKFSGANPDAAKHVLGLVTPAVMGTLGQQDPDSWSDGNGIAKFFADQKSAIAAAMPANLAGALSSTGLLKGFEGAAMAGAATAAASATGTMRPAQGAASSAASAAVPSGLPGWVVPAVIVVALALLGWYFLAPKAVPEKVAATTAQITSAVSVNPADLGKQAAGALDGVKTTLTGITSADAAKAALPKLTEATGQIDKIASAANALPAEAKTAFKGPLGALIKPILDQLDKVLAIPGVGDLAKPAIEALRAKLTALAA